MAEAGREDEAPLWGVAAEFTTPEALHAAILALCDRGLGRLEAFSPVPLPAAAAALLPPGEPIRFVALGGVLAGGALMRGMCAYATVHDYVFDIGGRPRFSWPYFVVPSVSFAMLLGALLALLLLTRLPRLNHPAFNIPGFPRCSQDRFFLVLEARGGGFDAGAAERAFVSFPQRPAAVSRVPR